MRSTRAAARAAVVALALACGLTACSDGAPAGPSAQELLRRAAETMGRAQSAVERIDVEQADGIRRMSAKVSWASPEIRADLGGGVRVVEGAAYQDASWAGLKWVRIDGPEGRPANAWADRAASFNTAGGFLRLRRQLNPVTVLTGAGASGAVENLGNADVGKVRSTRLRVRMPAVDYYAAGLAADERSLVARSLADEGTSTVTADLWIGAGGELVKRAETEDTSQGPRTTTTTYLDLGVTVDVQAPPASDLSSYQEMLQHAIHP
ncbi:hypothetical protein [Kitasatospora sp. MBT63]|uniref:hypothetical protein n=1 Tax=Kitasatospora sp. MBT63 TaxID=1444768 RepID=UPI0011EA6602|nr:hypothetical protein [Kitasatospora sp. MBT63]